MVEAGLRQNVLAAVMPQPNRMSVHILPLNSAFETRELQEQLTGTPPVFSRFSEFNPRTPVM
jgi:hypothetical protein